MDVICNNTTINIFIFTTIKELDLNSDQKHKLLNSMSKPQNIFKHNLKSIRAIEALFNIM